MQTEIHALSVCYAAGWKHMTEMQTLFIRLLSNLATLCLCQIFGTIKTYMAG